MGNINFWILLLGLISNLTVGIIAICTRYSKLLKILNISLGLLIPIFLTFNHFSTRRKVKTTKKEIVSFINDQKVGYKSKTLSEITEKLRRIDYDETIYSKAITELLKEKKIEEIEFDFHTQIQKHKCFIYKIPN